MAPIRQNRLTAAVIEDTSTSVLRDAAMTDCAPEMGSPNLVDAKMLAVAVGGVLWWYTTADAPWYQLSTKGSAKCTPLCKTPARPRKSQSRRDDDGAEGAGVGPNAPAAAPSIASALAGGRLPAGFGESRKPCTASGLSPPARGSDGTAAPCPRCVVSSARREAPLRGAMAFAVSVGRANQRQLPTGTSTAGSSTARRVASKPWGVSRQAKQRLEQLRGHGNTIPADAGGSMERESVFAIAAAAAVVNVPSP